MKRTEIAPRVVALAPTPLHDLSAPFPLRLSALPALALVPWFCDPAVQWAIRLTSPGSALKKSLVRKVNDAAIATTDEGGLLIGIPGDGIQPSTHTVAPIAEQLGVVTAPGMQLELLTANVGEVLLDESDEADEVTTHGNWHFAGPIAADGTWHIERTAPALDGDWLERAVACAALAFSDGPWRTRDVAEARAIVLQYLLSRTTSRNYIKRFLKFRDGAFVRGKELAGHEYALALAFFRERLAGGPFQWTPFVAQAEMFDTAEQTRAKLETIADEIVAG